MSGSFLEITTAMKLSALLECRGFSKHIRCLDFTTQNNARGFLV